MSEPGTANTADDREPCVLVAHPSPDLYGSDRVLLESVSGLRQAGYRVVTALPSDGPLTTALRERGSSVVSVPSPVLRKAALRPVGFVELVAEAVRSLPAMVATVRTERPSLLLVNTITIPLWLVVGRLLRVRVVCHVHEAEHSVRPAVRRLLYVPLLLAQTLVVNSRFSLGVLAESWRSLGRRGEVVYNGVPGPPEPQLPRAAPGRPVRLLFVGRLSPRKGPQVALAALQQLVAEEPGGYRLDLLGAVFPGYEWFEEELRGEVQRLGLEAAVTFLGFDPDIWGHLAASDVVVVPSTVDEPFGNTAVEALLAMRPLVVSETSGLREAAGGYQTARFVPAEDPVAIADAVQQIIRRWAEVTSQLHADRQLALSRHATKVYQRRFTEVVTKAVTADRS